MKIKRNSKLEQRRLIPGQKELLKLFDDLSIITLTNKTLIPSKQKNKQLKEKNKKLGEDEDKDDYYDYENQNKIIKGLSNILGEIIDKSKSFEEQIKLFKKLEGLKGYWPDKDYNDEGVKSNYFKIQLADMSNEIHEKLFEDIFGHALIKLANKVINVKNKEEIK